MQRKTQKKYCFVGRVSASVTRQLASYRVQNRRVTLALTRPTANDFITGFVTNSLPQPMLSQYSLAGYHLPAPYQVDRHPYPQLLQQRY